MTKMKITQNFKWLKCTLAFWIQKFIYAPHKKENQTFQIESWPKEFKK